MPGNGVDEAPMNGVQPIPRDQSAAQAEPRKPTVDDAIDQTLGITIGVVMNGMLNTLVGAFPFDRLMVGISRMCGRAIGAGMRGDLSSVLKLRTQCREAFDRALSSQPVVPPQAPPNG